LFSMISKMLVNEVNASDGDSAFIDESAVGVV
jgi:hypothetical protein